MINTIHKQSINTTKLIFVYWALAEEREWEKSVLAPPTKNADASDETTAKQRKHNVSSLSTNIINHSNTNCVLSTTLFPMKQLFSSPHILSTINTTKNTTLLSLVLNHHVGQISTNPSNNNLVFAFALWLVNVCVCLRYLHGLQLLLHGQSSEQQLGKVRRKARVQREKQTRNVRGRHATAFEKDADRLTIAVRVNDVKDHNKWEITRLKMRIAVRVNMHHMKDDNKREITRLKRSLKPTCDLFGASTLACLGPFLFSEAAAVDVALRNVFSSKAKSTNIFPTSLTAIDCKM
jgi:hypothetical protein